MKCVFLVRFSRHCNKKKSMTIPWNCVSSQSEHWHTKKKFLGCDREREREKDMPNWLVLVVQALCVRMCLLCQRQNRNRFGFLFSMCFFFSFFIHSFIFRYINFVIISVGEKTIQKPSVRNHLVNSIQFWFIEQWFRRTHRYRHCGKKIVYIFAYLLCPCFLHLICI